MCICCDDTDEIPYPDPDEEVGDVRLRTELGMVAETSCDPRGRHHHRLEYGEGAVAR